jgi:hypothetical protein
MIPVRPDRPVGFVRALAAEGGVRVRLAIGSVPAGFPGHPGGSAGKGQPSHPGRFVGPSGAIVARKADSPRYVMQRHDIVVLRHYA